MLKTIFGTFARLGLVLFCWLCQVTSQPNPLTERIVPQDFSIFAKAKAGDLVFRTGTELISRSLAAVDNDGFSHVGVLIDISDNWHVIHATPSETADTSGRTGVIVDDLAFFLAPQRARNFALYRINTTPRKLNLMLDYLQQQIGKEFAFVAHDASTKATYCTLLIWQAAKQAKINLRVQFKQLDLAWLGMDLLTINSLKKSSLLTKIN